MAKIGHYIAVYGPACSGKTTISEYLSKNLDIPHIELDSIFWRPQWKKPPPDEFRAEVSSLIEKHPRGWIFDGNYSLARDLILPHADTVIWVCPPFHTTFWRLLKRSVNRCRTQELLWGTNRENWRNVFLSRDSLILYLITHWRRYHTGIRRSLDGLPESISIVRLPSFNDIAEFLAGVPDIHDNYLYRQPVRS